MPGLRTTPFVLVACLLGLAASGASNGAGFACNRAGDQAEMNQCALEDFEAADAALNDAYKKLLRKEAGDAQFLTKLRKAQRAWIAFRDAEMAAGFACKEPDIRICWGSSYPLAYNALKKKLTDARRERLEEILKSRSSGAGY